MYKAEKAFDGNITTIWGGRPFIDGNFWIGTEFGTGTEVGCIKLHNYVWNGAHEVTVQALRGTTWTDIVTVAVSAAADAIISIPIPTSPSGMPSKEPSSVPSTSPSLVPSALP